MNLRKAETGLARFTLGFLAVYFPIETWASLPALWDPYYLIDLIGMILLLWGAAGSLRARPHRAPGVLCAAYAWTGANGWRATFGRVYALLAGGQLEYGLAELCFLVCGTVLALGGLSLSLWLVVRDERRATIPPPVE